VTDGVAVRDARVRLLLRQLAAEPVDLPPAPGRETKRERPASNAR